MYVDEWLRQAELAFLNAPFRPNGWATAMQHLADVTRTRVAQLIGVGGPLQLPLNLLTEQPHDPHGHISNPLLYGPANWRINTTKRPMTLEHEPHYNAYRERRGVSFYDDAVSDLDLPFGCQSALLMDSRGIVGVSLLRSSREGPCDAGVLDAFAYLTRQAQRAMRVHLALGEEASELMLGGLVGQPEATLLLDRYGNVCAMTQAAEALFDRAGDLQLDGHALRLADPAEDRALAAAFHRLLASDGVRGPVLHVCRIGCCPAQPGGRWRIVVARVPAVAHGFGFEPQLAVTVQPVPAA